MATELENAEAVRRLWGLFEARDWEAAARELHADFVAEWPHTGERSRGRDAFIELSRNYPEPWSIAVRRIVASGDDVAAEVAVADLGGVSCGGVLRAGAGKIRRATEYWVEAGAERPPAGGNAGSSASRRPLKKSRSAVRPRS